TFFLVRLLPGTPFNDQKLNAQQIEQLEAQYGLDKPVPVQYFKYLTGVFQGKLGTSFKNANQKVEDIIKIRIGPSAMLGAQSLVFGTIVGLALGIVAALKRNTIWDYLCTILSVVGVSVPSFVFAATLQLY
ncbi:ABC transporter permease, partial [Clostridium tertium]